MQTCNKIQTQVFQALYTLDENVFIGASTGSGETICAGFALMRRWSTGESLRAVCIEPYLGMVNLGAKKGKAKFGSVQGGKEILGLKGETSADLRLLEKGDLSVCTPMQVLFFRDNCSVLVIHLDPPSFAVGCYFSKVATAEKCTNARRFDR